MKPDLQNLLLIKFQLGWLEHGV